MPHEGPKQDSSRPYGIERVADESRAATIKSALGELQSSEKRVMASSGDSAPVTDLAVRRLTAAVWALVLVMALNFCVTLYNSFSRVTSYRLASVRSVVPPEVGDAVFSSPPLSIESRIESESYLNGFSEWPVEKRVKTATVVLITKHQKDGDRYKAVISEILKKDPGVKLYYNVGDEYPDGAHYPREGTAYGEGMVVFFTGSPPMRRFSTSIHDGRIPGFGDMPIDVLRRIVKE